MEAHMITSWSPVRNKIIVDESGKERSRLRSCVFGVGFSFRGATKS